MDKLGSSMKVFLEDTVRVNFPPHLVCVVTRTWHDVEDPLEYEDMVHIVLAPQNVDVNAYQELLATGQCPKHHAIVTPADMSYQPLLVRESDLTLLDRSFVFGDEVKRKQTDEVSGVIVGVGSTLTLRPCFVSTEEEVPGDTPWGAPRKKQKLEVTMPGSTDVKYIENVAEEECMLTNEWNEGYYVVYQNLWLGIIERVDEDITIRLDNGTCVIPESSNMVHVPIAKYEHTVSGTNAPSAQTETGENSQPTRFGPLSRPQGPFDFVPPSDRLPAALNPVVGQVVVTTKSNLRRGRWIYGSYSPDVEPSGPVVATKVVRVYVNWVVQNVLSGQSLSFEQPPPYFEGEEDLAQLKIFKKAYDGIKGSGLGGGQLQVGDTIRFRDIIAAEDKYNGTGPGQEGNGVVKRIPRNMTQGFDLNTFFIESTSSWVDVQWQDLSVTRERSLDIVPYWNMDEHECFPGEVVFAKDPEESTPKPTGTKTSNRTQPTSNGNQSSADPAPASGIAAAADVIKPKRVGVVQVVNAKERVAKVRWFENSTLEIILSSILPGTRTGRLAEGPPEDMSLYELVTHAAVNFRRGDLVLISNNITSPVQNQNEQNQNSQQPASEAQGDSAPAPSIPSSMPVRLEGDEQEIMNDVLRMLREYRSYNGENAMPNLSHLEQSNVPHLRVLGSVLSRLLQLVPASGEINPSSEEISAAINDARALMGSVETRTSNEADWLGEIVDLGLDGLVTIRLGGLDTPRDIRVPIELLTIIPTGDEGYDDGPLGEEYDEDSEFGYDYDDDDDLSLDDELGYIDEVVEYEGGERLDDDGGEEAWATEDDEEDDDDDDEGEDKSMKDVEKLPEKDQVDGDGDNVMADQPLPPASAESVVNGSATEQEGLAPEPISLLSSSIPKFLILDSEPPSDHAFISSPPIPMSASLLRRIQKEHKILNSSLPPGILVRTWDSRLDLLRLLIIGPLHTPYALAPFVIDISLPRSYPHDAPLAHFHSWTNGLGRVNPNLYEDGKICLSLLGTWHSESRTENWTVNSTLLQVAVSIMGLVLVKEPYFNEAGFNVFEGTQESRLAAGLYKEKAYLLSRGFVRRALEYGVGGLDEEVRQIYKDPEGVGLGKRVVDGIEGVIARSASDGVEVDEMKTEEGIGKVSMGAVVMLRKQVAALKALLGGENADGGEAKAE